MVDIPLSVLNAFRMQVDIPCSLGPSFFERTAIQNLDVVVVCWFVLYFCCWLCYAVRVVHDPSVLAAPGGVNTSPRVTPGAKFTNLKDQS